MAEASPAHGKAAELDHDVLRRLCELLDALLPLGPRALLRVAADAQRLRYVVKDDYLVGKRLGQVCELPQLLMESPNVVGEAVLLKQREALAKVRIRCGVLLGIGTRNRFVAGPSEGVADALHGLVFRKPLKGLLHIWEAKIGVADDAIAETREQRVHRLNHLHLAYGSQRLLHCHVGPAAFEINCLHHIVAALAPVAVPYIQQELRTLVRLNKRRLTPTEAIQ
mmetsp:Transcript_67856/g.145258  ORF Transcript_67856/g.145258 Transcript_67856/m.145258 type:complete len:224 (-) Transcript_67856:502-1173(-)